MLHLVFAEPLVSAVHIADDDGNVLKPSIVAARIGGRGPSSRGQELRQLDVLLTEAHSGRPRVKAEYTGEVLIALAIHFRLRDFLKVEHGRIKVDGAIEVGYGQANRIDACHQCVRPGEQDTAG